MTRSHERGLMPFFICHSSRSLPRALQCESRGSAGGQGSERDREEVNEIIISQLGCCCFFCNRTLVPP